MAYVVHRRRLCREERHEVAEEAAVAQRASKTGVGIGPPPTVVDLPALHRSRALKRKAIPILVAFARELAGMSELERSKQKIQNHRLS